MALEQKRLRVRSHVRRFAVVNLPTVQEVSFAVLAIECLSIGEPVLVFKNSSPQPKRFANVVVCRQGFAGVSFLEQIGAPEIEFFVPEQVLELPKRSEPANDRIIGGLDAGVVWNDWHFAKTH